MKLRDTINSMISEDWQQRLKAQYYQTVIRHEKLMSFAMQVRSNPGDFPNVSIDLLLHQAKAMQMLEQDLRIRCELQSIEILDRTDILNKE